MIGDYDINHEIKSMLPCQPQVPPPPTRPAIIQRAEIMDQLHLTKASLKTVPDHGLEEMAIEDEKCQIMPEFKNHVELVEPGEVVERETPDYLEPELIHQKERMRDIASIPRIDVTSPSPDLPELKPTGSTSQTDRQLPTPDLAFFPPPPNPAETAKMSLKPVLKKQGEVEEEVEESEKADINATRTPSRLTFGEKLNKFRAISLDEPQQAPQTMKTSNAQLEQTHVVDLPLPPHGMVTSTPAVHRILPSKKQVCFSWKVIKIILLRT